MHTKQLVKEAPDFMVVILNTEIPYCNDRLNIPIINTVEKIQSGQQNCSIFEEFLAEQTFEVLGEKILYADLWDKFSKWLEPNDAISWTKIRMGRELPLKHPKGRILSEGARFYVGNISWSESDAHNPRLILREQNLEIER